MPSMTRKNGRSDSKLNETTYRGLVANALPRIIHTEEENEHFISMLEALYENKKLSLEQVKIAELLTLLIETFEGERYSISSTTPVEALKELMSANNLRQADLLDVFGSASTASAVLNGKRELSKNQINRLTKRFGLPADVFFRPNAISV